MENNEEQGRRCSKEQRRKTMKSRKMDLALCK